MEKNCPISKEILITINHKRVQMSKAFFKYLTQERLNFSKRQNLNPIKCKIILKNPEQSLWLLK